MRKLGFIIIIFILISGCSAVDSEKNGVTNDEELLTTYAISNSNIGDSFEEVYNQEDIIGITVPIASTNFDDMPAEISLQFDADLLLYSCKYDLYCDNQSKLENYNKAVVYLTQLYGNPETKQFYDESGESVGSIEKMLEGNGCAEISWTADQKTSISLNWVNEGSLNVVFSSSAGTLAEAAGFPNFSWGESIYDVLETGTGSLLLLETVSDFADSDNVPTYYIIAKNQSDEFVFDGIYYDLSSFRIDELNKYERYTYIRDYLTDCYGEPAIENLLDDNGSVSSLEEAEAAEGNISTNWIVSLDNDGSSLAITVNLDDTSFDVFSYYYIRHGNLN